MLVPLPGDDSTSSVAPISAARSRMPSRPMPWAGSGLAGFEAHPIVFDHQHERPVTRLEHHVGAARVRVLDDVVEGLLRDAVEGHFHFARERARFDRPEARTSVGMP